MISGGGPHMARMNETRRITFNADARMLATAQAALGTRTATETINRSLAEVVRQTRLRRLAQRRFPDLTPEALEKMRRPRLM
jgi:hypothetical protein